MSKEQRRKARARAKQNYEDAPPLCRTCRHFLPPMYGVPALVGGLLKPRPYTAPHCALGDFPVKPTAICDSWESLKEKTLL